jgi:hypothetical protein
MKPSSNQPEGAWKLLAKGQGNIRKLLLAARSANSDSGIVNELLDRICLI